MRVLGIDPGSRAAGVAIIDVQGQNRKLIAAATLRFKGSMTERLDQIFTKIGQFIQDFEPGEAAIEKVFTAHNPASALKLGQARGVSLLAVQQADIPVFEYAATRVKKVALGHGRASKEEMQKIIQLEFKLAKELPSDASDAAAIALTHSVLRLDPVVSEESRL